MVLAAILAAILGAVASGRSAGPSPLAQSPSVDLPGISPATVDLLSLSVYPKMGQPAPDFHLTDQRGQPVSLSQFRGKSVVLSFNDDRCTDVCTLLAEDIVRADQDLGPAGQKKVVFLSVNVNPFYPQVSAVRSWSDSNGLGHIANWYFGTASPSTLKSIWKAYGVYVGLDSKTKNVTHSAFMEYIGPTGTIRATGDFGQTAVDVDPYSHGMAQTAMDLFPASERTPVAGPQAAQPGGRGPGLGQTAPPFDLPSASTGGAAVSLASLRGQPVVLNFWSSTCSNCRSELAAFAQVAAADTQVRFVGVDVADPDPAAAAALARSAGVRYPVVADSGGRVAASYQVAGLPTTVYIDPAGNIAVIHPGAMTAEQLRYTLAQFFPGHTPQGS